VQLDVFILGIDIEFKRTKELPALMLMKGTTTGADLHEKVKRYCKVCISQNRK
jgi:hypothetical protein